MWTLNSIKQHHGFQFAGQRWRRRNRWMRWDEAQRQHTAKNTKWVSRLKRLRHWLKKRQIPVDLLTASEDELAPILRRFYGELKTQGGNPLTPSSLKLVSRDILIAPWKITEKHVFTDLMDSFGCINGISTLVGGQSTRALMHSLRSCINALVLWSPTRALIPFMHPKPSIK